MRRGWGSARPLAATAASAASASAAAAAPLPVPLSLPARAYHTTHSFHPDNLIGPSLSFSLVRRLVARLPSISCAREKGGLRVVISPLLPVPSPRIRARRTLQAAPPHSPEPHD
jgi:hypothetical protein